MSVFVGSYRTAAIPDGLNEAFGAAELIAEQAPDDFAEPWVDHATGTVVLDASSSRGRAALVSIATGDLNAFSFITKAAPGSALAGKQGNPEAVLADGMRAKKVVARAASKSLRALTDLQHELTTWGSGAAKADHIWMSRTDPANSRVIVTVNQLSDGLASQIARRYGTHDVAVEVAQDKAAASPVSRWTDTSAGGFYGGARLSLGCTDAFSWHSGTTQMMLTAGHCTPSGGSVATTAEAMGSVTATSQENWSTTVGTQYLTGQTTYRGDMSLIQLSGSKISAGRIYRGNSESSSSGRVTGMFSRSAQTNDRFCTGGSSRKADGSSGPGEICGWTVDVSGVDYQYATGHWWRNVVRSKGRTGWCNRPGDSGAPVYIVNSDGSVTAMGILDGAGGGGSDYFAGALDFDDCNDVFTDIHQPYFGFPGVITVG